MQRMNVAELKAAAAAAKSQMYAAKWLLSAELLPNIYALLISNQNTYTHTDWNEVEWS